MIPTANGMYPTAMFAILGHGEWARPQRLGRTVRRRCGKFMIWRLGCSQWIGSAGLAIGYTDLADLTPDRRIQSAEFVMRPYMSVEKQEKEKVSNASTKGLITILRREDLLTAPADPNGSAGPAGGSSRHITS